MQLDNPGYGAFLGAHARPGGPGAQAAFERMVSTDAAAVAGVSRPEGVSLGMHVCRGRAGGFGPLRHVPKGTMRCWAW